MIESTPEWRLKVLKRAKEVGNVVQVCREMGMDRATFYKLWGRCRHRPEVEWLAALADRPRKRRTHAQQTTPDGSYRLPHAR